MSRVTLYALSTCIHCKNARKYLEDSNVDFDSVYVDTLQGDERKETINEVKKHNPACSFPTLLIEGDKVVVGFRKEEIKEALGL